jgi:hypothetical protein
LREAAAADHRIERGVGADAAASDEKVRTQMDVAEVGVGALVVMVPAQIVRPADLDAFDALNAHRVGLDAGGAFG